MHVNAATHTLIKINGVWYDVFACDFLLDGVSYREMRDSAFACDTEESWMDFHKAKWNLKGQRVLQTVEGRLTREIVRKYGKVEIIPGVFS